MYVEVSGSEPCMKRCMQQVLQTMHCGSAQKLSSTSNQSVVELANQVGNTAWRERMVLAEGKEN